MANDCLVTKLKAVVDNNRLLKLGEKLLDSSFDEGIDIVFSNKVQMTLTPVEGGFYASSSATTSGDYRTTPYIVPADDNVFVRIPEGSLLKIDNTYTLYKAQNGKIPIDFINGTAITRVSTIYGDVTRIIPEKAAAMSWVVLDGNDNTIEEILSTFQNVSSLNVENAKVLNYTMTQIGNILGFNVRTLNLPQNNTSATGDIADLVAALRTRQGAPASGYFDTNYWGTNNITCNGTPVPAYKNLKFTWDANSVTMEEI